MSMSSVGLTWSSSLETTWPFSVVVDGVGTMFRGGGIGTQGLASLLFTRDLGLATSLLSKLEVVNTALVPLEKS